MGKAFLYGNGGGSASGGTLTVTAPAGVTVTVSKDGKTKTKAADSSGVAVFKGLKSGTWTVSISDGEQTASKAVEITTDYSTAITFFSATINVTYPAGSTCTATDGVTTLTAPDTSGTWACVVPNAGTWTITTTNGEKTKLGTVAISTDGETTSITLAYVLELFKDGAEVVDWSLQARVYNVAYGNSVTLDNIKTQSGEGNKNTPAFYTTSKVDITDYTTLIVKVGNATGTGSVTSGIISSIPPAGVDATIPFDAKASFASTGATTISLDVHNFTGEYYIAITANPGWANHYDVNVSDVYLV